MRFFVFLLLFLAACAPTESNSTLIAVSSWGEIVTIARAEQAEPPALINGGEAGLIFTWVEADRSGTRQRLGRGTLEAITSTTVLTLPPTHPRDQSLYAGNNGNAHLLWMDADTSTGELALFSALITPTNEIFRGPLRLSNGLALNYSTTQTTDGSLWVAWSGGTISESEVHLREIDPEGRPQLPRRVALDAGYPSAVTLTQDTVMLIWLDFSTRQIMRGFFADGVLLEANVIAPMIALRDGDRLVNLRAAADATHGYIFLNITRANGQHEVWLASGQLYSAAWSQPTKLSESYRFAAPLDEQRARLFVGIAEDMGIGVLTLSNGGINRYERIVSNVQLIAPPLLYADAQTLYLAWASPDPFAPATLNFTARDF